MGHMMGPAHIGPVPGIMAPAHPGQPPFHGIHVQLGALPVGGGPPLPLGSDRVSPHGRYSAHRTCLFTPHTSHAPFLCSIFGPVASHMDAATYMYTTRSTGYGVHYKPYTALTCASAWTACNKSTLTPPATPPSMCASTSAAFVH